MTCPLSAYALVVGAPATNTPDMGQVSGQPAAAGPARPSPERLGAAPEREPRDASRPGPAH
eukprot:1146754-Rhodomonas_salina.1